MCILIPCHRVIGSTGRLTGYAGGLRRKRALLEIEQAFPATIDYRRDLTKADLTKAGGRTSTGYDG
jgi:alkylated DNA nucleotide flippase Atl1